MNTLKRTGLIAVLGGVAATVAVAVPNGSAQDTGTPGATILSFYEPDAGGTFRLIDNAPKSPAKNPQSSKYRFSIGDKLVFSSPLYDKKGGTRLGTLYADSTVTKGTTFANIGLIATATYVLNDGSQISVQGAFTLGKESTAAIVGGTGRYEGARGHLSSTNTPDSSTDTLTLLP
jgi:hypothetical protein